MVLAAAARDAGAGTRRVLRSAGLTTTCRPIRARCVGLTAWCGSAGLTTMPTLDTRVRRLSEATATRCARCRDAVQTHYSREPGDDPPPMVCEGCGRVLPLLVWEYETGGDDAEQ